MENINLNYTRLNLFGYEPELLGSYEQIFSSNNITLISDMIEFFKVKYLMIKSKNAFFMIFISDVFYLSIRVGFVPAPRKDRTKMYDETINHFTFILFTF